MILMASERHYKWIVVDQQLAGVNWPFIVHEIKRATQ